ncbi:MAG: [LysW]-lysine hydrolase [Chloroflexota bacterium]
MTAHENVVARRAADVALLHRMVEIPSLSGQEGALARYLCGEMAARGLHASIDEAGNAVGEVGEGGPLIVLLGHMDTVGGAVPVRREGTLLYGRGAVDAKGPLATFLAAASAVAAPGNLAKRVVVVGAVEEETATSRGARHILHRYTPDYVVIGEPSGWSHLTIGYKGRLLAYYHLRKAMQHTAAAGPSACEDAVAFWNRVAAWCEDLNRGKGAFDSLTPSLRAMHSSSDGLVEEVRATLGFRLPPGISPAEVRARLESERGPAEVAYVGDEQAVRLGKSNPLVRGFLGAIRAQGGTPGFKVETGTSDMNVVASGGWECPMLAYGPGDSSLDHTPREHIDLDEYGRAIDVLTAVLEGL